MKKNNVVHAEFSISRELKAPVSRVYQMFADKESKEKWFGGPSDKDNTKHSMDFRNGGTELDSGKFHDGVVHTFKAQYYDIVPEQRVVYCYEMYLDDVRISVSVTTIEFAVTGDYTEIKLHEYGVFLDGYDKPENRERGTKDLLKTLEDALTN